ncbi:lysozyme [Pseudomonas phage Achelous]|uniref:Lysozyme n=1 Tax=Pseudomonas phage Achelous TaxID=2163982 RepID=A0A2S1GMZ6_9CAUD|nr:lysozyme [Pseudomonas phage Achelous]AWD90723.1 lysozyme [Pseudomonas phage Achelous]
MLKQRLIALGATMALAIAGAHIGSKEGLSLKPYLDGGGVKTWCYGQTQGIPKMSYSVLECDKDLLAMTSEYMAAVTPYLRKDTPATVVAAFTSTAVNIGKSGWRGSQFTNSYVEAPYMVYLRAGRWKEACDALEAPWPGKYGIAPGYKATIGGYPSKGLGNRRASDATLCRSGL